MPRLRPSSLKRERTLRRDLGELIFYVMVSCFIWFAAGFFGGSQ